MDNYKSIKLFTSTQQSYNKRDDYYDAMHKDDLMMKQYILNTIAFSASNNADTLYYHQDMKAPDAKEFQNSILKEVNTHIERNHWEIIPI